MLVCNVTEYYALGDLSNALCTQRGYGQPIEEPVSRGVCGWSWWWEGLVVGGAGGGKSWWEVVVGGDGGGRWWWEELVGGGGGR